MTNHAPAPAPAFMLTLALAAAAWVLFDRLVLNRPWAEVYKALGGLVVGFLVAHLLSAWAERRRRASGKAEEERNRRK